MKSLIPEHLDGIRIDVQESLTSTEYPISIASFYETHKHCSIYGGICRLECMTEQKLESIRKGVRNKVDLAFFTYVTLEEIEIAARETGLFLEELEQEKRENEALGEYYKGPGASLGRYFEQIDSIFPGAGKFMKALRRTKGAAKVSKIEPVLPTFVPQLGEVREVGSPELGMKVFKVGATGITEGKIKALDASLIVDYPHHLGLGAGNADFGEPVFSPSPLRGGRFPRDIIGFFSAYVPIRFVTEIHTCPWAGRKPGFPKPPYKRALFEEQIVTDAESKKEDSGAPLISENHELLGMHFAGSDRFSFFNSIQNVIKATEKDLLSTDELSSEEASILSREHACMHC